MQISFYPLKQSGTFTQSHNRAKSYVMQLLSCRGSCLCLQDVSSS